MFISIKHSKADTRHQNIQYSLGCIPHRPLCICAAGWIMNNYNYPIITVDDVTLSNARMHLKWRKGESFFKWHVECNAIAATVKPKVSYISKSITRLTLCGKQQLMTCSYKLISGWVTHDAIPASLSHKSQTFWSLSTFYWHFNGTNWICVSKFVSLTLVTRGAIPLKLP